MTRTSSSPRATSASTRARSLANKQEEEISGLIAQRADEWLSVYRGDSVSEYVGAGGLGAFVDGKYSPGEPAGAMLGYIQRGSCQAQAKKVKDKLGSSRREHGLERSGPVWQPVELDGRIGPTWVSTHNRANETPIRIYHSFLPCS